MRTRVGIIGCGGIARTHLAAYQSRPEVEVVAVYDACPQAAQKLAGECGAAAACSLAALRDEYRVEAVSVCTPPGTHLACCLPFLEAGIPVLCEKPLAANLADALALAAAANGARSWVMPAFCHRFHPSVIMIKRLISEGVLGRPLLFRNLFGGYIDLSADHRCRPELSGGGCLIDHCAHSVDLFRFLAGEPERVQALAGNVMQELAIEDFGMMHLRTADSVFGEITASYSLPVCSNVIEWYGTLGTARITYFDASAPALAYRLKGAPQDVVVDCSALPDRFAGEIAHFLDCVCSGKSPSPEMEDGVRASRIIAAAYESVAEGRAVCVAS